MRKHDKRNMSGRSDAGKGLVAGLLGGVVASAVMNQFQKAWSRRTHGFEKSHGAQTLQTGVSPDADLSALPSSIRRDAEQTDATEKLADAVSEVVSQEQLTPREREAGGTLIHYLYGASMGATYGVAAELAPGAATAGAGTLFGAALWLTADEGLVPALGLSKSADEYPLSVHAYALSSHLVYGLTTELVRRAVRRALD